MATYYWKGGGGNNLWSNASNWTTASAGTTAALTAPVGVDDVIFDGLGTNGNTNSNINNAFTIRSLNITSGYTAAMSHSAVLTISGSLTLGPNHTIFGSSGITIVSQSTLTSNGKVWPNALTFNNASTRFLFDNFQVNGIFTNIGGATTLNTASAANPSASLICVGGITPTTSLTGNAKIVLAGGTWNSGNSIANDIDISGSITVVSPGVGNQVRTPVFRWITGSVTTAGTILTINPPCIFDVEPITWNVVRYVNGGINFLSSSLNVAGAFSSSAGVSVVTFNTASSANPTASLNVRGGIWVNTNALTGNAKVFLIGGTWSGNSYIQNNTDISGSITLGSTSGYGGVAGNVLRWVSGSVTTEGSTFRIGGSGILDVEPVTWNNLTFAATNTITLSSSLNISGSTTVSAATTLNTASAANPTASLNVRGGLNLSGASLGGNAKVVLIGGTWSGGQILSNNVDISGSITIGTAGTPTQDYRPTNGILRYITGSVTLTPGHTLLLSPTTCSIDTSGITWNNIRLGSTALLILSSSLNVASTMSVDNTSGISQRFTGSSGFDVGSFVHNATTTPTTGFFLTAGNTYMIRNSLTINTARIGSPVTIASTSATERAILTLSPNATCNTNANFTRIDASLGRTIRTFNGTITDCLNIEQLNDIITNAGSFVATI